MTPASWEGLNQSLDRWVEAGRVARLWLRDDDAVAPGPELDRLLQLAGAYNVPLTLAIIPAGAGTALARRLDARPDIGVAVHGWSHTNHAPPSEKKQELGLHRPRAEVISELAEGLGRLQGLFGDRLIPLLVPPWNRIDPELLPHLPAIGFAALSVFGAETAGPIPMLNTHVDVIDWRGSRGGRSDDELLGDLLRWLGTRLADDRPVGVLTHHLVHDERVWGFLERLFDVTAAHPGCQWCEVGELVG